MEAKRLQIILAVEVVLVIALVILATLFLRRPQKPSLSALYSNDFWVCATSNPTGNGAIANPFDGSTRAKFDGVMNSFPPNCTIHLLVGTYQTYGTKTNAWVIKTGQKIIGGGIDNTIIHLNYIGGGNQVGNTASAGTNIEVSDLTIDGAGTINYAGLYIWGDHSAIRRVKAVNFSNSTGEIFPLAICSSCPQCPRVFHSEGNVIEECEVNITNSGPFSAISMGGGPGEYQSGAIRNNRIVVNPLPTYKSRFAINVSYGRDITIEGNFVYGADVGLYSDGGPNTNLTVIRNMFQNVLFGTHMINNPQINITCSLNHVALAPVALPAWNAGFDFEGPVSGRHRDIFLSQNTIQFYNAPGSGTAYSSYQGRCTGVRFIGNRVDFRLWPGMSECSGVEIFGNSDLDGAPWPFDRDPPHSVSRSLVTGPMYDVLTTDRYVGIRNGGLATTTIHLPTPANWPGKEFVIAREDGGAPFTLATVPGRTINGANSLLITKGGASPVASVTVTSDGTNWFAR